MWTVSGEGGLKTDGGSRGSQASEAAFSLSVLATGRNMAGLGIPGRSRRVQNDGLSLWGNTLKLALAYSGTRRQMPGTHHVMSARMYVPSQGR